MSYGIDVVVKSPVFNNKLLKIDVNIGGIPGPPGSSVNLNFDAGSVNITGLTTLNQASASAMPSNAICASVSLSGASASLDTFTNMSTNLPVRFFPAAGIVATVVHGVGTNNPRCQGGLNASFNGDNKEWFELTKIGGIVYMTNYGKYSLI